MSEPRREASRPREPRLVPMLGWSAALLAASLAVAALALPILHWLGFDPR